jgi:hypothetical protein
VTYALKDINPDYALKGINAAEALRRAADTVETCAISDHTDALLVLWARAGERLAMGTLQADEVDALVRLMRG